MTYPVYLVIALAVYLAAMFAHFRLHRVPVGTTAAAAGLSVVCGILLAKLLYVTLLFSASWRMHGWAAFIQHRASEFSIFGGCLGAVLAVWLCGKISRQPRLPDLYAPILALGICLLRAGEYFTLSGAEMLGAGEYIGETAFGFFPFAVINSWEEPYFAVNLPELLTALIVGVFAFFRLRDPRRQAGTLAMVCFVIALVQIFCESLRSQCMKWGFVRIEQVMSAVVVFALFIAVCRGLPGRKKALVLCGILLCILMIVALEFAMDKTDIAKSICYIIMAAVLLVMGLVWFSLNRQQVPPDARSAPASRKETR